MYVSIGIRARIEAGALNMVETLGAEIRHRTVTVIKKFQKDGKVRYKAIPAPAVSGQALANAYSRAIVELALRRGLPLTDQSKKYQEIGGFIKFGDLTREKDVRNVFGVSNPKEVYNKVVEQCVVADLTGFLIPGANARKTSPVSFSFMVPDVDSVVPSIDPQFHVRYNFETNKHSPFTEETSSAMYMLHVGIDVNKIGVRADGKPLNDRLERIEVAFDALLVLLEGQIFGAKRSRHTPVFQIYTALAAVSQPMPFSVSAPRLGKDYNFIEDTVKRASKYVEVLKAYKQTIKLYLYTQEIQIGDEKLEKVSTVAELFERLKNYVKSADVRSAS